MILWWLACATPCPDGLHADPARSADVLARISEDARICWGPVAPSVVDERGLLRLDERLGRDDAAARVAHLLVHSRGTAPAPGPGCLDAWIDEEGRAWAREIEVRASLGLAPAYPFEAEARGREDRARWIADWLRAHPDGAPGVDGLATAYAARCR